MKRKLKCVRQTNVAFQIFERFFVLMSALHCMHADVLTNMYMYVHTRMYVHAHTPTDCLSHIETERRARSIGLQAGLALSYSSRCMHAFTRTHTRTCTLTHTNVLACIHQQLDLNFNCSVRGANPLRMGSKEASKSLEQKEREEKRGEDKLLQLLQRRRGLLKMARLT